MPDSLKDTAAKLDEAIAESRGHRRPHDAGWLTPPPDEAAPRVIDACELPDPEPPPAMNQPRHRTGDVIAFFAMIGAVILLFVGVLSYAVWDSKQPNAEDRLRVRLEQRHGFTVDDLGFDGCSSWSGGFDHCVESDHGAPTTTTGTVWFHRGQFDRCWAHLVWTGGSGWLIEDGTEQCTTIAPKAAPAPDTAGAGSQGD